MIGTNNLSFNTDKEIVDGLQLLLSAIHAKQPAAKILLLGILPRRDQEERVQHINQLLASTSFIQNAQFTDAGSLFLKANKKIDEGFFSDGLHPNESGYEKLGSFINGKLSKM